PPPGLFRGQSYFDEGVNFFPPTGVNLHRLFQVMNRSRNHVENKEKRAIPWRTRIKSVPLQIEL
ncbi:hypothetical protein, partial [Bacteroides faecichinchillae]|uniref:hypothetical protein n=1 Tax=Bacteroides faecichinchillae TaxID=871325 RepID=UPI001C3138BF